jgi:hypothetical protein
VHGILHGRINTRICRDYFSRRIVRL